MQRTGTAGALAVQASRAYEFGGFVLDGELKLSQGGIGWIHLLDLLDDAPQGVDEQVCAEKVHCNLPVPLGRADAV
jgi:hypothetical protein